MGMGIGVVRVWWLVGCLYLRMYGGQHVKAWIYYMDIRNTPDWSVSPKIGTRICRIAARVDAESRKWSSYARYCRYNIEARKCLPMQGTVDTIQRKGWEGGIYTQTHTHTDTHTPHEDLNTYILNLHRQRCMWYKYLSVRGGFYLCVRTNTCESDYWTDWASRNGSGGSH